MAVNLNPAPASGGRRRLGTSMSEINVTPLVDVMLVLLIIFMVTAPMMQSGIGINLPQAETESAPAEEGLTLTITADGYIHLGESVINVNLLERRLQEYFFNKTKKIIYIRADRNLNYGQLIQILDIVKKSGIEIVGLVTEPLEKPPARKQTS
ncbi:MAG: biopolymer transporter ExbD [Candidatus Saccharicenans sp.]|jgi:biopolymer transport protein TolR|nr:biopolymer transporter ExbD [Candidatus Saccharicenans sp.]MDH7575398.1 biopolymer transporter ExbD [Candidatus Saccharicenans sp.]